MAVETLVMETLSRHGCFGGAVSFHGHHSQTTASPMRFSVFVPPQAAQGKVPVLYYLAGLSCTEETFMAKTGAQRVAAELGLMLVAPDTSPRGLDLPGERESWDFGEGAGFYLDATREPWARHYRMYSYVTRELPELVARHFPADMRRQGIFGHSMGGHGALTLALRNPEQYRSVSAFSPVAAPIQSPWGQKAFNGYLGADRAQWRMYDATELMNDIGDASRRPPILVDQGLEDQFLAAQLHPELFAAACARTGQRLTLRRHAGFDHGYYFISTFMEDHLRHHALHLNPP